MEGKTKLSCVTYFRGKEENTRKKNRAVSDHGQVGRKRSPQFKGGMVVLIGKENNARMENHSLKVSKTRRPGQNLDLLVGGDLYPELESKGSDCSPSQGTAGGNENPLQKEVERRECLCPLTSRERERSKET